MKVLTSLLATALLAPLASSLDEKGSTCSSSSATAALSKKDIIDTAVSAGSFQTLAAALEAGGLVSALKGKGPFTVFAPTDKAFAALPEGTVQTLLLPENRATLQAILEYHVVAGNMPAREVVERTSLDSLNGQRFDVTVDEGSVRVADANVIQTDISCSNGTIHVIDRVIMPSTLDIVATAMKAGQFKTLGAALKAAGLVEALQGSGPFTVFAPTDEAFSVLPQGTLSSLLLPENKGKLAAILQYHVVPGRIYSEAAAKGASVNTLQGTKITTRQRDGKVFVNGARVVLADIQTSNGVIHVIDSVLLPE